jgi:hypothetical protein
VRVQVFKVFDDTIFSYAYVVHTLYSAVTFVRQGGCVLFCINGLKMMVQNFFFNLAVTMKESIFICFQISVDRVTNQQKKNNNNNTKNQLPFIIKLS